VLLVTGQTAAHSREAVFGLRERGSRSSPFGDRKGGSPAAALQGSYRCRTTLRTQPPSAGRMEMHRKKKRERIRGISSMAEWLQTSDLDRMVLIHTM
jgi:hypothetical protein